MWWLWLGCAPAPEGADAVALFLVDHMATLHQELVQFQMDGTDPQDPAFVGVLAEVGDEAAPFNAVLRVSDVPCATGAISADVAVGGLHSGGADGPWSVVFNLSGEASSVGCPEDRARGDVEGSIEVEVEVDEVVLDGSGTFGGTAWSVNASDADWLP